MLDDLGAQVPLSHPPRRVVSLVPSLTEALATTVPGVLVGATSWCAQPADLDVVRVRGTKNPDRSLICSLSPDLVVANQEENRRHDVERLRAADIPVWVTRIDGVDDALTSLGRLFAEVFSLPHVGWLDAARDVWAAPPNLRGRVAVAVWRDPWIWVGAGTYPDDVLRRLGLVNVVCEQRYPSVGHTVPLAAHPDLFLLPDEPYPFTAADGPDVLAPSILLPGRSLFWYGPAMVDARASLEAVLAERLGVA